ncbi:MAG TPA: response regulator [Bryobacteraceae bacterium]|jgi:CheY-like chemotaxis protein
MPPEPMVVHAIDILLVEDSAADVRLTREALRHTKLINRMVVASDGVQAMAMLRNQAEYASLARPDLILLDLNLPKKNGRAVLEEIKQDPDLKRIPVVIITSSTAEEDVVRSYDLHANCYITKPLELGHFVDVVRAIEEFWVGIVKLPPK